MLCRPFKRLRKLNQDHSRQLCTAFHWRRHQERATTADCVQSQTDATARAPQALTRADGDSPQHEQDGPTAGAHQLRSDSDFDIEVRVPLCIVLCITVLFKLHVSTPFTWCLIQGLLTLS